MTEPKIHRYAIMVHGGAKKVPAEKQQANRDGVLSALRAAQTLLDNGGNAIDAAEAALIVLESNPAFNCGYGSTLNKHDEVEMDAALMDGRDLQIAAVGAIQGVPHPITVAKTFLEKGTTFMVADGAREYAKEHGVKLCDPGDLIHPEQVEKLQEEEHDTVGCVILQDGHLVAATSTGGLTGNPRGRVGDSPLAGCGFYAENGVGAVVLSGEGEQIMRYRVASRIMDHLKHAGPEEAVKEQILEMARRVGGEAGGLVISASGEVGWFHNSEHFPVAYLTPHLDTPQVFLSRAETQQKP